MVYFLSLQIKTGNNITISDICFKPLHPDNDHCSVFSYLEWWQNSEKEIDKEAVNHEGFKDTYLDHFKFCSKNPASPKDSTRLEQSCLGKFGGPVDPNVVLGGFFKPGHHHEEPSFKDANTAVITYVVNNYYEKEKNEPAREWEKAFLTFMEDYIRTKKPAFMDIAYSSERSIQDELKRESEGEITTVVVSYLIMFLYIAVNLGQINSVSRLLVSLHKK